VLFICFLFHAVLWFIRALVDRLQQGGHATLRAGQYALPRFDPLQRSSYTALAVAFVGLTASGVALKYSDQPWGQWLARGLGGFRSASFWHHFSAVLAILAVAVQMARTVFRIQAHRGARGWKDAIFGPDSLVPNGRDVRELGTMLRWFIGFGPKPGFERWAYWEKLDFWAFSLAALLIGISGLMMWYPNLFCLVLPGMALNVAKMVHSEFAIYVASFLFLIHFFHAHFRPEKFPLDLSVMTGMVSEEHLRKYRPDYVARLEREDQLDALRENAPSGRSVWLNIASGVLIFSLGLCLLAITILASLGE
jgi:cytochrome b subunit of formate dehydrogenase